MIPLPDETHDPALRSWAPGADGHADFPIQNLPFGVFSPAEGEPRAGVAIGDYILDLRAVAQAGLLPEGAVEAASAGKLNALLGLSWAERIDLRRRLSTLLSDEGSRDAVEPCLQRSEACSLHLPAAIGDYTDFYVGIHHAQNVGRLFRPDHPLLPNYKHVPIGYHGRASSVRVSGVPVTRPNGQSKAADAIFPQFGPSRRLDYELELGVWIGPGNPLGSPIPIAEAPLKVAGLCLLNDWSARDLQAWEYQPLGPFLSKNFQTTISPWIVTTEALAPFRVKQVARPSDDPQPLPYLWNEEDQAHGAFAIALEVWLSTVRMREAGLDPVRLSQGSAGAMYWTVAQMVTHHASGGCNLHPGDLLGTGTISSADRDGLGSLMEITRGGAEPFTMPNGEIRRFLEDGDEVIFTAKARAEGWVEIGFGPCRAVVLPAGSEPMLRLHGYWRSTASYRVRIALNLKGLDYEQTGYDLRSMAHKNEAYRELAAHGLVPALETGQGVFIESPAILEWIEECWPALPLLPAAAQERAIVRAMASLITCDIHPLNNLRVLHALRSDFNASPTAIDAWIGHWIGEGFAALELMIAHHGGEYAFGDAPTLADCCLVPQVFSAERFRVDLTPFPAIVAAASKARAMPAVQAAAPERQPDADR